MRTAEDIVRDYRARGYSDERLRALANGRPEPIRGQILDLLGDDVTASAEGGAEDILAAVDADAAPPEALPVETAEEDLILVVDPDDVTAEDAATETAEVDVSEETADADEVAIETAAVHEAAEMPATAEPATAEDEAIEVAEATEAVAVEEAEEEVVGEAAVMEAAAAVVEADEIMEADEAEIEMIETDAVAEVPAEVVGELVSTEADATQEVVVNIDFEEDSVVVVESETNPAPALTDVEVEHLSADEYYARQAEQSDVLAELIDLRLDGVNAGIEISVNGEPLITEAVEDPVASGEHWPSVTEVEAAASTPDVFEKIDSDVFIVFQEDSEETVESIRENRAARRSLKVLQDALREDPDLVSQTDDESKVIDLDPPYAIQQEDTADQVGPLAFEDDILVERDESGLIRFPTEMLESYEAIASLRNAVAAVDDAPAADAIEEIAFAADQAELFAEDDTPAAEPVIVPGEMVSTASRASDEVENEIALLRNWLTELEDALKLKKIEGDELTRLLNERDETLALQAQELEGLRQSLHSDEARMFEAKEVEEKLQTAMSELGSVRQEMAALEREYNILATGTVPDLMQDKEDLVELLEAEASKQEPLKIALHDSGRRVAIGYTLAAAASVLVVFSLVFQWVHGDSQRLERQNMLAELKKDLLHEKEQSAALQCQREKIERDWLAKYEALETKHSQARQALAKAKERVVEQARELAEFKLRGGSESVAVRTRQDVERDNGLRSGGRVEYGRDRRPPRNDVTITQRPRQARSPMQSIRTKIGTVRPGEGISHVLWRELGMSSPELVEWVVRMNKIHKHARGYYIVHPNDKLILPADPAAVVPSANAPRAHSANRGSESNRN